MNKKPSDSANRIKLASYNIRKSVGTDWVRDSERIINVLREIDADIVILQEVDRRFGSRQGTLSTDKLKQQLGYCLVNLAIRKQSQGWHGNAILYRTGFKILDSGRLDLPTFAPRGAISALFQYDKHPAFRIIGTHLALLGNMRKKQINTLINYIEENSTQIPTIIAGDFNEWKQRGVAYRAFGNSLTVVTPGPSFHSSNPKLPLDRFVLTNDILINNYGVYSSEQAIRASDHLPIFIDIEISNNDN